MIMFSVAGWLKKKVIATPTTVSTSIVLLASFVSVALTEDMVTDQTSLLTTDELDGNVQRAQVPKVGSQSIDS